MRNVSLHSSLSIYNSRRGRILSLRPALRHLYLLLFVSVGFVASLKGQISITVTGNTNTTPNLLASYTSLATALTDLNAVTAMAGPVVLTCASGTSETAPVKGFVLGSVSLNAVLSATNTLTINKSGGTVTINAGVGTATPGSASPDGMLYLNGADFVTINGLTFTDGNTTNPATMEFGIALFKRAAGDGCNNNTIQNCTFNMQRVNNATGTAPMVDGAVGILVINSTATAATTPLTPTNGGTLATNGTNSGNKFYTNTINSGNIGIALSGFAASSGVGPTPTATTFLGDLSNDVGGSSSSTGNSILNYGGGATTSAAAGIRANNQWSISISYNTIDNNNGSGVNHATTLRGIYAQAGTSGAATISYNTVTVRSGATTSILTAIDNGIGSTAVSGNTVSINSNTIRFSYTTATTGVFTAINNSSTAGTINILLNNIQQLSSTNYPSTGTIPVIVGGSPGGPLNITNNTISNFVMTGASGTLRGITASTPTGLYTVTDNTVENLSYTTVTSTGSITGIYNLASATLENWNNNIIRNFSTPTTGTLNGIQNNTVTGTFQCQGNQIYNFSTTSGGAGGFSSNGITWSNSTVDISGNAIYSINSTGTTGGTAGSITGISASGSANIYKNRIYDLSSTSTNPAVSGIAVGGGTTVNVYNNFVSDLRAASSTGLNSVIGLNFSGGTTVNASYNTVYLGSGGSLTGGATFGGAGVYVTSTTALNLKNNIVNVKATGATGYFAALKRSTGTAGTKPANITATNNIYFVSPAPYVYGEGTTLSTATNVYYNAASGYTGTADPNFNTSCGLYKVWMAESGTFWEDNLTATTPTGPFVPSGASYAESNATTSTTPSITDDFAGTTRPATPDCGALEFSGTLTDAAGPSITYTNIPNPANICAAVTLSATITDPSMVNTTAGTAPRLWYKKQANTDALPATNDNSTDGWKYVEATGTGPYTFTVDYNKIFGGVAGGDVIQYFVAAQDNVATPNVSTVSANYASGFCPSTVALASGAFPLANTTGLRTFTIPALGNATAGTTTASPATICVSGTASIGMTPTSGTTTGFVYDVQSSPAGQNSWTNVATGLTSLPYTTGTITAATDYRVIAKDCNGATLFTAALVAVTVNSPMVTGTTPATRCGTGTVTLGATGSAGTTLNWYAAATGGASLGAGTSYTTLSISSTTNYYVGASNPSNVNVGPLTTSSCGTLANSTASDWPIRVDINNSVTINTFDVFTNASGSYTFKLRRSLSSTDSLSVTATLAAGLNTVTVNWANIPSGNWQVTSITANLHRISTFSCTYPYISAGGSFSIVGSATTSTSATSTSTYNCFFNFNITEKCESARTPVTATVNTPPALNIPTATPSSICLGTSSTLNVSSSHPDYTYTWNPGNLPGASVSVSPSVFTTYTVTAQDNTTGNPFSGCINSAQVAVTVNPLPSAVMITPAADVTLACGDPAVQLTASGGILSNVNILTQNFNGVTNSWTTVNNSTGGTPANAAWTLRPDGYVYSTYGTWHSNDNTQFYMSNSDAQGSGGTTATELKSPSFSTQNFTSATITFYHYFYEPTTGSSTGKVEASTDGTNWTTLQTYNSTTGAVGTFATANISLTAPFLNQAVVYIRFKYDGVWRYFWGIDNVSINGDQTTMMTWAPTAGLFTDPGATSGTEYTGGPATTVYALPAATTTYTATATSAAGCMSSASRQVTKLPCALAVNTKVFLSTVSAGAMPGTLRTLNLIPTNDPYADTGLPYAATGNFTFVNPSGQMATTTSSVITSNNVIDWVFVELRSPASTVVASKSALLKEDGIIINPDGSALSFSGVAAGNYHVAIKHRNHLGFRSDAAIALPNASLLNFTDGSTGVYPTTYAALRNNGGVYSMWPGDINQNGSVYDNATPSDRGAVANAVITHPGNTGFFGSGPVNNYTGFTNVYSQFDVNLDGQVFDNATPSDAGIIRNTVIIHPANTGFFGSGPVNNFTGVISQY